MHSLSIKCVQAVQEPVYNPVLVYPLSYTGNLNKRRHKHKPEDKPPYLLFLTYPVHTALSTTRNLLTPLLEQLLYPFSTPPTITTTIYN